MRRKIRNYSGPGAGYVLANGRLLRPNDPEAILALTDSALMLSLGPTAKAGEYRKLTEARNASVPA